MHQFYWVEERQSALRSMKRIGFWGDFFATLVAIAFLIDAGVVIVQSIIHGTFLSSPTVSVASNFLGRDFDTISMWIIMSLLIWAVVTTLARGFGITGWEPIASLPVMYLALCGLTFLVACLSLVPHFSFYNRELLTFFLVFMLDVRRNGRKKERKQAQAALVAKAEAESVTPVRRRETKNCEICQQGSFYDICLNCEKKYRVERHRVRAQILRAKQSGVPATLTLKEWLDIIEGFQGICAYCQSAPFVAMEHFIPIVEGGGTTADNCVPACTSCNSKKSSKHPEK